jgi:hypothetical protein
MMFEGRIIALGTPAEIKQSRDPLVHKFLSAEFKIQTETV